jgi:hypothetical protein
VYTFWRITYRVSEIAAVLGAVLLLVAMLLWLLKRRSGVAALSTCGAVLAAVAQYLRHPVLYWRPAVHSHFLFLVYSYGLDWGGLLVALGLVWHFARLKQGS